MPDTTLEVVLERRLRDYVRGLGGNCIKFEAEKGLPDRIITLPGFVSFFVELKRDQGKLSPIQRRRIPEMRIKGAVVTVMYGEAGLAALTYDLEQYLADVMGGGTLVWRRPFNARRTYCRVGHPQEGYDRHFPGMGDRP